MLKMKLGIILLAIPVFSINNTTPLCRIDLADVVEVRKGFSTDTFNEVIYSSYNISND